MSKLPELVEQIMASQDPARGVAENVQELERVIVIEPPYALADMISVVSHWKQHGTLENYDSEKLEGIAQREKQTISDLSDAFKRIVLIEVAGYISGTYAIDFPNDLSTRDNITRINREAISLTHNQDCSHAHKELVQVYGELRRKKFLEVTGRSGGAYLESVGDVLKLCAPDNKDFLAMNVGFAGRNIKLAVNPWGEYAREMERNPDFAEFKRRCKGVNYYEKLGYASSLFNPISGYTLLRTSSVEYAKNILDQLVNGHHTLNPADITIGGRNPLEAFREAFHLTNRVYNLTLSF